MDPVAWITLAIFVIGGAVSIGRLSARVENLEEWRRDLRDDLKVIRRTVDEIAGAMRSVK